MARSTWATFALAGLLLLFGARLVHTASVKSFTIDEPHYAATGLYLWETGDYDFYRVLRFHPPLAFHLASLPLPFSDALVDLRAGPPDSHRGQKLVASGAPELFTLRLLGRLPFVLLSLWGAFLCFVWARGVAGPEAGVLAAFLFSFSPTVLGHGALAHSDITLTVMFLQTLVAFDRWWQAPSATRLVLCGVSLGLALLSKLTAVLLLGILPVLVLLAHVPGRFHSARLPDRGEGGAGARALRVLGVLGVLGACAVAVMWLGYGGSFALAVDPNGRFPDVALPGWLRSFLVTDHANRVGRSVFFWGDVSSEGFWSYFPVAFTIKETLAFVVLTGAAFVSLRSRRGRLGLFLAAPFVVYAFALEVLLRVPLGYRYALPLVPLLAVFIATQLWPASGRARVALGTVLGLLALESGFAHPHYIAHFNPLVGGPGKGHHYLLESNLDWGQDVQTLARELETRGRPPVRTALYGPEPLAAHGVRGAPLVGCAPAPHAYVAISRNVYEGLYAAPNPLAPVTPGCYAWLRGRKQVAAPGHSILLFAPEGS